MPGGADVRRDVAVLRPPPQYFSIEFLPLSYSMCLPTLTNSFFFHLSANRREPQPWDANPACDR